MTFFTEKEKSNSKFHSKHQRPIKAKAIPIINSNVEGIIILDLIYYTAIVTKAAWQEAEAGRFMNLGPACSI